MQCSALSLEGRGGHARIVPTWELSWLDTECELCGGCLSVCPTGAIYEKFEEGTSRPERALEQVRTTCTFCGVGCQIDLNLDPQTKRIVKVTSKDEYLPERGQPLRQGPLRLQLRPPPGPADAAARPRRGRRAPPDDLGARARDGSERPEEGHRRARPAVGRLPLLGPADERGELPHPEARPHGGRDELRPLLRIDLTRARLFTAWSGRWAEEQVPTRSRRSRTRASCSSSARTRPRRTRARTPDQEGRPQRRDARRRRPAEDLADEDRQATPAASPGDGRLAPQRDDAHDPRRGAPERGLHPRVHRRLRCGPRGRHALHARGGGEGHGRSGRGHPRRPRANTRRSATRRSSTRSASPSTPAASTTSGRSRTSSS